MCRSCRIRIPRLHRAVVSTPIARVQAHCRTVCVAFRLLDCPNRHEEAGNEEPAGKKTEVELQVVRLDEVGSPPEVQSRWEDRGEEPREGPEQDQAKA